MKLSSQSLTKQGYPYLQRSQGFTLIELMIAIVLGLLITAAAVRLFLTSSNSYNIQKAAEDVQEAEVFAIDNMRKEIAMANLGSYRPMKQESPWTGLIFTTGVTLTNSGGGEGKNVGGNLRGFDYDDDFINKQSVHTSNINESNNDQLVISYRAPFDMINCEGKSVSAGNMIVERYYTDVDTATKGSDPDELSLALWCDAGTFTLPPDANPDNVSSNAYKNVTFKRYKDDADTMVSFADFGDSSTDGTPTIIVNRIDAFKVKFGVQSADGIKYMTINEYMAGATSGYTIKDPVVAVQFAVITRAANPVNDTTQTRFTILGQTVNIKNVTKNYVRRVYESTVRIRNSGMAA